MAVVVEWSASLPSTPTIWDQILPDTNLLLSVLRCENKMGKSSGLAHFFKAEVKKLYMQMDLSP